MKITTIYCTNGNPNFWLFQTFYNFSGKVMFVGDFNSKLKLFSCANTNNSGPLLRNIQTLLKRVYLNNEEHTHLGRGRGSTDILGMAFVYQNLTTHDIQFQIDDDLGSNHLPIDISTTLEHTLLLSLLSTSLNRLTEKFSNQLLTQH